MGMVFHTQKDDELLLNSFPPCKCQQRAVEALGQSLNNIQTVKYVGAEVAH